MRTIKRLRVSKCTILGLTRTMTGLVYRVPRLRVVGRSIRIRRRCSMFQSWILILQNKVVERATKATDKAKNKTIHLVTTQKANN